MQSADDEEIGEIVRHQSRLEAEYDQVRAPLAVSVCLDLVLFSCVVACTPETQPAGGMGILIALAAALGARPAA